MDRVELDEVVEVVRCDDVLLGVELVTIESVLSGPLKKVLRLLKKLSAGFC